MKGKYRLHRAGAWACAGALVLSLLPVPSLAAQTPAVSLTLFAFSQGEEIGTHDSAGDAMVTVLEGTGKFTVNGKEYLLQTGQALVMPAKKPHAVFAQTDFKMLLTVVFPQPAKD